MHVIMTSLHKISEVFRIVQKDSSSHKKYLIFLKNVYLENEFNDFVEEFVRCLKHFLFEITIKNQNKNADNALKFCALFCVSIQTNNTRQIICPFFKTIILQVLELHDVDQARYRVCFYVNQLISYVGNKEGLIDTETFAKIRETMLQRIQDVKSAVQVQAIQVLQKLQEPQDPNDPVIKAFIRCLRDRNSQVRRAITRCIGVDVNTIPYLLKACFDVDESVRFGAYTTLSNVPIIMLKIEQRQHILVNGLKDKNKNVQSLLEKTLLTSWLSNYNGNYFELICALKLDADELDWKKSTEIVEKVLNIFFSNGDLKTLAKMLPLDTDKLIATSEVKWEELIYWHCLLRFASQLNRADNCVEEISPDLSTFCTYILRVYNNRSTCTNEFELLQHDQLMSELFQMIEYFDLSDEVGRQNINKLIRETFIDAKLLYGNIHLMVNIFERIYPCPEERTNHLSEIIYEIRNPWNKQPLSDYILRQRKVQLAQYKVELNIAIDTQEQVIEKGDVEAAEELQPNIDSIRNKIKNVLDNYEHCKKIRVERNDIDTLSKCLDILIATLTSCSMKTVPNAIRILEQTFTRPLLVSLDTEIYLKVMNFYGLICIIDEAMARKWSYIFCNSLFCYNYMSTYVEQGTLLGVCCITDLLLMHGKSILGPEAPMNHHCSTSNTADNTSAYFANIVEILSIMLDDASPQVREKSCEAVVKLMRHGVLHSSILLSKLILKWFNPATAKETRLRQLLGCLFVDYVTEVPGSLECIEKAFIPTLSAIIEAPRQSPLANVNIESALKFLIELCRPTRHKCSIGLDPYKNISLLLCNEICAKPNEKNTTIYLKALILLDPPMKDETAMNDLNKHVERMFELIKDKSVLTYVKKYENKLKTNLEQTISTINMNSLNISRSSKVSENNTTNSDAHCAKKSKKNFNK